MQLAQRRRRRTSSSAASRSPSTDSPAQTSGDRRCAPCLRWKRVLIHNLILDGSVCLPPLRMRCYLRVRFVCSAGSDSPLSLGDDQRAALRGVGLDRCDPWTHTTVLTYTRRNATSNATQHELVIRPRSGQDKAAGLDVDLGALDQILSPFRSEPHTLIGLGLLGAYVLCTHTAHCTALHHLEHRT